MKAPDFIRIEDNHSLTPNQIVAELDQYVVGQTAAKRAVAIALRNRWRRQQTPEEIRSEIVPNNIIMIGPTGVGKTEIARRLARLAGAPLVKVEATKFTEVGYVGRDVESMIRDLAEVSITQVKAEWSARVESQARDKVEERLLELLLPASHIAGPDEPDALERQQRTREKLQDLLRSGALEERLVTIDVPQKGGPLFEIFSNTGSEEFVTNLGEGMGMLPGRRKKQDLPVREARPLLHNEEVEKLVDMEKVRREALHRAENSGIVFLDEIDKIAGQRSGNGPDVSRQGVQRDLLPIVEGSNVTTKHGVVSTDHILFIAAGAFHSAKPSDLIPELQGRFPIRVELSELSEEDFVRILQEPRNALVRQYEALLETEDAQLSFEAEAIEEIAKFAARANEQAQNIGARRLHTVMTTLLDSILFDLPEKGTGKITITAEFVRRQLADILGNEDLSRYIL